MFYPSYYDTSSIINENKPLRRTGVNGSKILCKFEVQNLYLKLEGLGCSNNCWFNQKCGFKSKMLTRPIQVYSFVPQFDACLL